MTFHVFFKIFPKSELFPTLTADVCRFLDVSGFLVSYPSFHVFERSGAVRAGEEFVDRVNFIL